MMGLKRCRELCQRKVTFVRRRSVSRTPPGSVAEEALALPDEWSIDGFEAVCFFSRKEASDLICELWADGGSDEEILGIAAALYPIQVQAQMTGGLPLHAALLERDGQAVAIAAPSGTGKSTCCRRIPAPWRALCDDEVLVVRDAGGAYQAHPFPTWSEYVRRTAHRTWNVQRAFPLRAVFLLQRSPADFARPLGKAEAAPLIYHSARQTFQRYLVRMDEKKKRSACMTLLDNACLMARQLPVYALGASLGGSFWEKIDQALEESDNAGQGTA